MKKSLVALAVLAASGASFAQSSVTLYGVADAWIGQTEAMGVNSTKQTKLGSGGVASSRFGFMGSEDLGGGLKANFKLEQGFGIDTGAAGQTDGFFATATNASFSRYAYVGFSGGFGEVKLGKTGTAYDDIWGSGNSGFDSALSANNEVLQSGNYSWNPSNSIYYATPSMSGFSAAASYSLGENKDTPVAGVGAGSIVSMNVQYGAGPIAAALGYQVQKPTDASTEQKFTRLTGSYNFGMAKLIAGYGRVDINPMVTNEYELGVDFPVSSALVLSAGIAHSKDDATATSVETTRKGYSLAANYTLSKRTAIYGGYRAATTEASGKADQDGSLFAVGVTHRF